MADLIDREALLKKLYEDCRCMNTHFLNAVRFAPSVEPDADTYYSAGIKVCPFCEDGGRMSMIETANGQHYVQCDKCGANREKILADTDGAAIDIWNSRYMKKEK